MDAVHLKIMFSATKPLKSQARQPGPASIHICSGDGLVGKAEGVRKWEDPGGRIGKLRKMAERGEQIEGTYRSQHLSMAAVTVRSPSLHSPCSSSCIFRPVYVTGELVVRMKYQRDRRELVAQDQL